MKQITKQQAPEAYIAWTANNPSCSWKDFGKTNEYTELKSYLCNEQEGLCCYCEVTIKGEDDTHIEHYKPKSKYQNDTYNYQNLLASCEHYDSCGHKKGGEYWEEIVSPLSECECRFTYTGNGQIIPTDENDEDAGKTISTLGLDCNRLRDLRKSIIKTLEICDDAYVEESLINCKKWFEGFYTVINQIANSRRTQ